MKKISTFLSIVVLSSVLNISVTTFSYAEEPQQGASCSASDPCGTWAMVNDSGIVTNVIVCQASVCGSGTWDGQRVVPQFAPNPVTHDTTGTGGYFDSTNGSIMTESNGTFTVTGPSASTTFSSESDGLSTTEYSVSVPNLSRSFRYEDTINRLYGEYPIVTKPTDPNDLANMSVKQINQDSINEESMSFTLPKTDEEIKKEALTKSLNLLLSKIDKLLKSLSNLFK